MHKNMHKTLSRVCTKLRTNYLQHAQFTFTYRRYPTTTTTTTTHNTIDNNNNNNNNNNGIIVG